jgi:hypothetical protein
VTNRGRSIAVGLAVSLLISVPAWAQGKSDQDHGKSGGATASGAGNSGKSSNAGGKGSSPVSPPSQVALAAPTAAISTTASTPFAWIDNANLVAPGTVWLGLSVVRWHNLGLSEVSVPVIDAAVGMTPRVQIGASVPRIAADDTIGRPGGLGTTFLNAKLAVLNNRDRPLKVAVTPTLEILSQAAIQFEPASERRLQWGLPVSVEFDRGLSRIYGSTGYFSPGVWYSGAGAATQITARLGAAVSFSRSWTTTPLLDPTIAAPRRHDLSTGASLELTSNLGVFGSIGRTIGTAPQYGAGTTFSVGLSLTANKIAFTH